MSVERGKLIMELLLIRHGEPTYEVVTKRGYKGHGRDLGPLTTLGIKQAKTVAQDKRLQGAEIIIASPYTRALQTAAIISRELDLDIIIENDLHEWMPDLSFNYTDIEYEKSAGEELTKYQGEHPKGEALLWEPLSKVADRAITCMKKYLNYKKVIVVAHGIVIRQFKFKKDIDYCEITEVNFDENFIWSGWIKH